MSYIAPFHRARLTRAFAVLAVLCAALWMSSAALASAHPPPADQSQSTPGVIGSGPEAIAQAADANLAAGPDAMLHVYLPAIRQPASPVDALLAAINGIRAAQGCPPLASNAKLAHAAQVHSQDMADHGFFSHQGSDGSWPHERVLREGYSYAYIGETIARSSAVQAEDVLNMWLNSPGHERIILNCTAEDAGVGYSDEYWTLVLANSF